MDREGELDLYLTTKHFCEFCSRTLAQILEMLHGNWLGDYIFTKEHMLAWFRVISENDITPF